ncbi:hypothetical protein [Halorarius litoreus]|uniref:hypothetical protein n=1 Tax=Halorarius litoreus TaxID=2962676 RepID=UPI0020CF8103|nr:hypothetical protein [Halorarius litoreus]
MDRRQLALPAVVLGPVVALALVVGLGVSNPLNSGPGAFAVGVAQLLLGLLGAGVFALGVHGYRTGRVRPAVFAAATVLALAVVAGVGAYYEQYVGFLVPMWVWGLAVAVAIAVGYGATTRLVTPDPAT